MEEWYCFKCQEKMELKEVVSSYLEMTGFVDALKCPKCGKTYLTEEVAVEIIGKAEEEIEAKME